VLNGYEMWEEKTSGFSVGEFLHVLDPDKIMIPTYKIIEGPTKIVLDNPSSEAWDVASSSFLVVFTFDPITACRYVCTFLLIAADLTVAEANTGQVDYEGLDHIQYTLTATEIRLNIVAPDYNQTVAERFWTDHRAEVLADNYIIVPTE
jgi:hypothetical protein